MKKRVLIVEDNSSNRQMEKDLLEVAGYEVLEADNAKDGTRLAKESSPDLIVMDIRLPFKMRGIGAAKTIRSDKETRDIPIVFVTAHVIGKQINQIKSISKSGFITKPINTRTFVKELEQYL